MEYAINGRIAEEYSKYRLDSAIFYAERNLEIAGIKDDDDRTIESSLQLAFLYADYGLFWESQSILDRIRPIISEKDLTEYYQCEFNLYDNYSLFSERPEHRKQLAEYADSISLITGIRHTDNSEKDLKVLHFDLDGAEEWTSEYSLAAYYLAAHHENKGQLDSAKHYYTLSAISDIQCSNRNQGAMSKLANLYYDGGRYTEAYKYASSTIEDAISGNMKIRTTRISEIFKIINDAYQTRETQNKRALGTSLGFICVLLFMVILLLYYVFRQILKLRSSERELSQVNANAAMLNSKLMEQNEILLRANVAQEKYIAHFFELSSVHLGKMADYQHSLRKLMTSGKFDDLNRELRSNEMVENELHEQYIMFDKIFLDLYPTFVEDFNALLDPENRIILKPGELLNTELRIYALMRVGFADSAKIASFLRCSMSTIYTYRTKSRNRSRLSRETFEEAVMKIGSSPRS